MILKNQYSYYFTLGLRSGVPYIGAALKKYIITRETAHITTVIIPIIKPVKPIKSLCFPKKATAPNIVAIIPNTNANKKIIKPKLLDIKKPTTIKHIARILKIKPDIPRAVIFLIPSPQH